MRTFTAERDTGYRGIWYQNQPVPGALRYKYSGGFATYPQQHVPIAIYAPQAAKTFFVYGATPEGKNTLWHAVSYFDHKTGTVPRPALLLDKKTDDAHDNPTLALDDEGYLWVFSNAHGTGRPSFIHKSTQPYAIDSWERVLETNFSYGQPWWLPGKGFVFLHTRYSKGRGLFVQTSRDGRAWEAPRPMAFMAQGHYQVSWPDRARGVLTTAFDYHPAKGGLNARTNLYALQSRDAGRTWTTLAGSPVSLPLREVHSPALLFDYEKDGLLVYLKDVSYTPEGRVVVLYLTSKGFEPGPQSGPYEWWVAVQTADGWERHAVATSDHNYDHGSLYIESATHWRVIAPTAPGPQPGTTGGEVVVWQSTNSGKTWRYEKALTANSPRNHTYVRRPLDAHPAFYALWADGNPLDDEKAPHISRLYFTTQSGEVYRLPERMTTDTVKPERHP